MADVPRARILLDVIDVGDRGFEITITLTTRTTSHVICAPTLSAAMPTIKGLIARELWGDRQPPKEGI